MKITIIAVGKIKEGYYREAISEYAKRLSRYCRLEILETADEPTPDRASCAEENAIKAREAERILKLIRGDAYVIALEIRGGKLDSVQFSRMIENLGIKGSSHITFIIGGSLGLHESVISRADKNVSFSDMTFPHQLMRVLLLEQIYRGFRIANKEPYHK